MHSITALISPDSTQLLLQRQTGRATDQGSLKIPSFLYTESALFWSEWCWIRSVFQGITGRDVGIRPGWKHLTKKMYVNIRITELNECSGVCVYRKEFHCVPVASVKKTENISTSWLVSSAGGKGAAADWVGFSGRGNFRELLLMPCVLSVPLRHSLIYPQN